MAIRVHYASTIEGETLLSLSPDIPLSEAANKARLIGCNILVFNRFGWAIKKIETPVVKDDGCSHAYIIK